MASEAKEEPKVDVPQPEAAVSKAAEAETTVNTADAKHDAQAENIPAVNGTHDDAQKEVVLEKDVESQREAGQKVCAGRQELHGPP
jgi:hypothetical protein